jgi:hypothetical protein
MDWITLALSLGDQILKKIPNYDQKKRNDYYNKKKLYNQEKAKTYPLRDDDLLLSLKEDLFTHLEAFKKEIQG